MEGLAHRRLARTFALGGELAWWLAERAQEQIRLPWPALVAHGLDAHSGHLGGSGPHGPALEFQRHAAGLALAVQQLLGAESPDAHVRIIYRVLLAARRRRGGKLVGAGIHHEPDHVAQVEMVLYEIGRERVEQLGMGRGIGRAKVIHRIHKPAAHEMKPDSIDLRAGETMVLRIRQPGTEALQFIHLDVRLSVSSSRQRRAGVSPGVSPARRRRRVPFGPLRGRGRRDACPTLALGHRILFAQETRRGGLAETRIGVAELIGEEDNLFPDELVAVVIVPASVFQDLVAHAGENTRPVVIIVLCPALVGMVMALRALEARAQKHLCGRLGPFDGCAQGAVEIRRRLGIRAPARGHQFAGKLVERLVGGEARANPLVKCPNALGVQRPLVGAKQVHPLERPKLGELGPRQQRIDEPGPLVPAPVGDEPARLVGRRQDAEQIQERASAEHFVCAQG